MQRLLRLGISVTSIAAVLAAVGLSAADATASAVPRPGRASAAGALGAGGKNDYFNGDSCTSSTFCLAVGAYDRNGLSELFRGGRWIAEPVRRPSRGRNIFGNEVSCASPSRCLLVGDHYSGARGLESDLAEAWDGSSWRTVTVTGPPGTAASDLTDVACPTTGFCLAIGAAGSGNRTRDTAYTWTNGTTWRQITVPRPPGSHYSQLAGLACFSASMCMAVGNYATASGRYLPFAVRWDKARWKLLAAPVVPGQSMTSFQAISCPATTLCVAAGDTFAGGSTASRAFTEVWSGGKWKVSTLRQPTSAFTGVSCPARNRCFAVGYTSPTPAAAPHALIETWNGRTWTTQHPARVSSPRNGADLAHVSCSTRTNCEAVGERFRPGASNGNRTLAEVWNGHRWTLQTTANP